MPEPTKTAKREQALLDPSEAAAYFGVSRSHFDEHIRPLLPIIDMKPPRGKQPMWRFMKADLDALIASRRRVKSVA